jgi:hypothetical protein
MGPAVEWEVDWEDLAVVVHSAVVAEEGLEGEAVEEGVAAGAAGRVARTPIFEALIMAAKPVSATGDVNSSGYRVLSLRNFKTPLSTRHRFH